MNNSTPPSNSNTSPTEPLRIGHYELRQCIGRGGMGLVYRARDTKLEREVAIKCLRTELFEDHYVERFKREALLLAKLNHPNIVQIYDFIDTTDQLALVMELVDGQNLQTYLREHIVSIAQRLQWLVQITEGMAIAHDAGIIHRDLKTENILINQRGQAKITDLGIAKSQDFKGTLTDHVAGSYCSMSPEQAMGETITFKSDLFSLGILAYQLLCGAHPFGDTSNKLQTMQRIISHPPTTPQKYNPDLPAEFIDLLGQLLSKDPDKRPDNTHWVAAQFEKLKALSWQENTSGDDTQALVAPLPSAISKSSRTQDHPTFDTRFVAMPLTPKVSAWQKLKRYIAANKITLSSAAISLLIIAGVVVWQLQPKPPKYVAVIPPKLTSEGMPESQQALVEETVYDAIQQSMLQLDDYYLIPQNEIFDITTANTKEDIETIRRATAADEIITTDIRCRIEACTITLSRLTPESGKRESRLRVYNSKKLEALTDSHVSIATTVSKKLGELYLKEVRKEFQKIEDADYSIFIDSSKRYRLAGASFSTLDTLEKLQPTTKKMYSVQELYREISLDLYSDTKDKLIIERLRNFLSENANRTDTTPHLYNLYNLQLIEGNFEQALETTNLLTTSKSKQDELIAHILVEKGEYELAIEKFKKSLTIKKTAHKLFSLANVYWLTGNNLQAKKYLDESLSLSPNFHKAQELLGLIALLEGNVNQAVNSFESIIAQRPTDIASINNLGLSYLLKKNYLRAFELFNTATEMAPKNNTYLINRADARGLIDDKNTELYQKLVEKINTEEKNAQNLRYRSQAYAHIGKISEALIDLQQVEKIDAQNIETIYTAALVHTLANNKASAILNIEKSLNNNMNIIWFSFKWFDGLCSENEFLQILKNHNEHTKCHP